MDKTGRNTAMSPDVDAALSPLFQLPLFANLSADLTQRLAARIVIEDFAAGDPIIHQDSAASDVVFLLDGEVAVTRDAKLVTLIQAPEALGLIAVLDGHRRTATLNAFTSVRIARIATNEFRKFLDESHSLKDNLLQSMAAKLRWQYGLSDQVQRHFDDFFRSPNAELVKGPYVAAPFPMYVFLMEGDPDKVAALLPKGLKVLPGAGGRYLLLFNFFESMTSLAAESDGRSFAYHETASFVPCLGPRLRPGLFVPELYPDNFLAITLGRELYGFPKRFARTSLNAANRSIDLVLDRQVVLRAEWEKEASIDFKTFLDSMFADLWPTWVPGLAKRMSSGALAWANERLLPSQTVTVPVLVHKYIPNSDGTPSVDQLKEVPFHVNQLSDFTRLDGADVRILDDAHFLHGVCRGAFRLRLGLRFAEDRIIKDFRRPLGLRGRTW